MEAKRSIAILHWLPRLLIKPFSSRRSGRIRDSNDCCNKCKAMNQCPPFPHAFIALEKDTTLGKTSSALIFFSKLNASSHADFCPKLSIATLKCWTLPSILAPLMASRICSTKLGRWRKVPKVLVANWGFSRHDASPWRKGSKASLTSSCLGKLSSFKTRIGWPGASLWPKSGI